MAPPAPARGVARHGRSVRDVLVDTGGRKSLFKMGKLGILWQLDRETGAFIRATDLGYRFSHRCRSDHRQSDYRPGMVPEVGKEVDWCPSTAGFKSWRAMAFSPQTNAMYLPLSLSCEKATFGPTEKRVGGGGTAPSAGATTSIRCPTEISVSSRP